MLFCMEYVNLSSGDVPRSYFWFICVSTILLYTVHRYIGYHRVQSSDLLNERYKLIQPMISFYPIWGGVMLSLTVLFTFTMGISTLWTLAIPCIISGLYVLPIFGRQRRLRDFPFVKIFLIAITWTWFSTWYLIEHVDSLTVSLIGLEHLCFMIGITLPFDIRDIEIDQNDGVKTIATELGKKKTGALSQVMISLSLMIFIILVLKFNIFTPLSLFPYAVLYILIIVLVSRKVTYSRDIMITGVLEGGLLLKGLLGVILVG